MGITTESTKKKIGINSNIKKTRTLHIHLFLLCGLHAFVTHLVKIGITLSPLTFEIYLKDVFLCLLAFSCEKEMFLCHVQMVRTQNFYSEIVQCYRPASLFPSHIVFGRGHGKYRLNIQERIGDQESYQHLVSRQLYELIHL